MALRQAAGLLVPGACTALLLGMPAAAGGASAWRPAVERLAQERTLAEACVALLESFAEHGPLQRVQAQRIYARARADADGLIALLQADLAGDRSPAAIPELRHRLESVPRQRQALCEHADAAVGRAVRAGAGSSRAVGPLAARAAATATSLVDAAALIWEAYQRAGDAERARIIAALEATRWRDYTEVSPGAP